ncbi:head-tail adaptor protein [Paracoccus suum]|uniref:Head-tail adaptor protein n=1 Tax=Paracoccus suum TaxID=2259340 RepID=A0A344PL05_9RHOB|nr:head-tail adaptor protein [Paracoccus suum]AXC50060.1 head-tail adaptor protein [Paracoccus suum]
MKRTVPNLDYQATFSARETVETDMGGTEDAWVPQFTEWAAVKHLRGGESVMQARLASRNPVIITIRNSARARRITSEWQAELRDRTGIRKVYAIKEDPRPTEANGYLEMLAEG